jgi:predicted transcriptional regulator/energy-coupling factor transporter ATP-binding protein EcfA2
VARLKRVEKPLINGILERHGMLLLIGPSGVGKSMLTLHIALNVAAPRHNRQLWDLFKIEGKERVLIVQSENSLSSLNKRVTNMTKKNSRYKVASKDVLFIKEKKVGNISGDVDDDRFMNSIKRVIFQEDIGLLILDPLISYHSQNENDNVGMRKVLDKLSYVCETYKVAAIVVHHVGKNDAAGKLSGGRGASSIGDWAANILSLSPYDSGSGIIQVDHLKSRDSGRLSPFCLRMTEHFDFERQEIDPKELESNDKKARAKKWADIEAGIIEALNDASHDQQTLIKQVAEGLNMSPSTIRRTLKRLVKRGKVVEKTEKKEKIYSLPN